MTEPAMTPVERVCAILAERDLERFAPGPHTDRLRKDLALGWQPTAERIVRELDRLNGLALDAGKVQQSTRLQEIAA